LTNNSRECPHCEKLATKLVEMYTCPKTNIIVETQISHCADCDFKWLSSKDSHEIDMKIQDILLQRLKQMRTYSRHNLSCDVFSMKAECSCGFSKLLHELGMK
jgi:hypothetical protein